MQPIKKTSFTHDGKNYTLDIHIDESPENPFTNWDCEPPIMYVYDSTTHHGTESIVSDLLDIITDRRLVLNKKIILDAYDYKTEEEIREEKYEDQSFADALRDELIGNDDNIELVETLASVARVPFLRFDSRGYSQGDYIDALIILTPEYLKKVGTKPKYYNDILKGTKDLFNSYIWGDVYGFQLVEHVPLTRPYGTPSTETEDNIIDSCWGFYGEIDSMKDNLPDFARPYIDELK